MATMRRASLNTGKPIKGDPKPKKEKGYQIPGKFNKNGTEYGATRRGISQVDRTSDSEMKSADSREVNLIGGGSFNSEFKSKYGKTSYPMTISELSKKTDIATDKSKLNANERGKRESLARFKQDYENEKMSRVKSNYSDPKRGNARGDQTFVKRTVSDKEQLSGKFTSVNAEGDQSYGANKRFQQKAKGKDESGKNVKRNQDIVRSRKNLLGRTVTKTKTAEFGAVVKGTGSKSKQVGDKVIKKTRSVSDSGGIPFIVGKNARNYGQKTKSVSRVATSTKKGMAAAGDVRGAVSNSKLGKTYTAEDVKSRKLANRQVVERSNSNRRR